MKKLVFLIFATIFALLFCRSVFAADPIDMSGNRTTINISNPSIETSRSGIVPCGGSSDPCTLCHLIIGIKRLIDWGKNILVTVTIVGIFISGIIYVVSSGNEKMITKAKSFLSASLIGFSVTLAAWLIVNVTIFWVANAKSDLNIGITNWYTFTCDTTSSANETAATGDLAVDPSEITFEKTSDTKQIKVSYKGEDVTKSATYESKDKDIATVSSEGLVTNKATFSEGEDGNKSTTISVTYNDKTATVKVVAFSGTCKLEKQDVKKISTPSEFTYNNPASSKYTWNFHINKAYAEEENSYFMSALDPSTASLKDIKENGELWLSVCTNYPDIKKFVIGIDIISGNVSQKFYVTSQNFQISSEDSQSGTKTYRIKFPYEKDGKTLLSGDYDFGATQISSAGEYSTLVTSKSLSITDSSDGCQFVYGNKDAKFILILARINTYFVGLPSQPCLDSLKPWDGNNTDQLNTFKDKVDSSAKGILFNNLSDNFGVYRSDKVFETTEKNICPDVESGKDYVSYGWIQNGSGAAAYAHIGGNCAYHCIESLTSSTLAHEQIGHNFAYLLDEYTYSSSDKLKDIPAETKHKYNCTTSEKCTKWQTIENECYTGCTTSDSYRSSFNSLMRNHLLAFGFSALQEYIIRKTIENYPNQASALQNLDE